MPRHPGSFSIMKSCVCLCLPFLLLPCSRQGMFVWWVASASRATAWVAQAETTPHSLLLQKMPNLPQKRDFRKMSGREYVCHGGTGTAQRSPLCPSSSPFLPPSLEMPCLLNLLYRRGGGKCVLCRCRSRETFECFTGRHTEVFPPSPLLLPPPPMGRHTGTGKGHAPVKPVNVCQEWLLLPGSEAFSAGVFYE